MVAPHLAKVPHTTTVTDVYTNLHGLQGLKTSDNKDQALKQVAQQFESLFVSMLMKSMRSANEVFAEGNPFHSEEGNVYRDMLDQQRALSLAHGRGFGIADALYRQLSRNETAALSAGETMPLERKAEVMPPAAATAANTVPRGSVPVMPAREPPTERLPTRVALADSPEDFIDKVLPYAKKAARLLGANPLVMVAQAALETGWGRQVLANAEGENSFNLFNIKRGSDWQRDTTTHTTLEFEQGVMQQERAEFRVYRDVEESFNDFVALVNGGRYAAAREVADDPQAFIREIHRAGYATDPAYSEKVLAVYQRVQERVNDHAPLREVDDDE